jgi:hypothetical protein
VTGLLGIPTGLLIKFVPLVAAALVRAMGWQPSEIEGQIFTGCVLIGILLLTALAAWRLRRSVRRAASGTSSGRPKPSAGRSLPGVAVMVCLVTLGLVWWSNRIRPHPQSSFSPPVIHQILFKSVAEPVEVVARSRVLLGRDCREMQIQPLPTALHGILRNATGTAGGGTNNWQTVLEKNRREAPLSLDAVTSADTTSALQIPDPTASVPDTWFDRQWATTVVDGALAALGSEAESEGKTQQFSVLKPWLLGEVPSLSQADAALQLDLSEGAVKVAIHRLRKRFREVVKAQIAQTVEDPTQVREELRYLVDVLAQSSPNCDVSNDHGRC